LELPNVEAMDTETARATLAGVVSAVLAGAMDPSTARSVAYLLAVDQRLAEGSEDLLRRMEKLEQLALKISRGRK